MFLFNDGKLLGFHMDFLSGKYFYRCRGIFFFKDFFYNEKPIIHLVLPILVRKISAIEKKTFIHEVYPCSIEKKLQPDITVEKKIRFKMLFI